MHLKVADRHLMIYVVIPRPEFLRDKTQPFHDLPDILRTIGVKQYVDVSHLAHAEAGIQVLQDRSLQRHIPDARLLQLRQHSGAVRVQQCDLALRLRDGHAEALVLHAGRLQRHAHHGSQLVLLRRLEEVSRYLPSIL